MRYFRFRDGSGAGGCNQLFKNLVFVKQVTVDFGLIVRCIMNDDLGGDLGDILLTGGSDSGTEEVNIVIMKFQCG